MACSTWKFIMACYTGYNIYNMNHVGKLLLQNRLQKKKKKIMLWLCKKPCMSSKIEAASFRSCFSFSAKRLIDCKNDTGSPSVAREYGTCKRRRRLQWRMWRQCWGIRNRSFPTFEHGFTASLSSLFLWFGQYSTTRNLFSHAWL